VDASHISRSGKLILSGHQPVYLPGIILFNKIALSDMFMFVGHCQYVKKSWHSRNRIRLHDQELWLTIPVKTAGRFDQAINDTYTLNDVWKRKHQGSIRQAYQKAPFFSQYYPELEQKMLLHEGPLGDLNISIIKTILNWLDIKTPILDSRDYAITGTATDMLISMCRAAGADHYLSNEGSRAYVDEEHMAAQGIKHCWQLFEHPVYRQVGKFVPNLSVLDLLFNVGPDAREIILNCGKITPGSARLRLSESA